MPIFPLLVSTISAHFSGNCKSLETLLGEAAPKVSKPQLVISRQAGVGVGVQQISVWTQKPSHSLTMFSPSGGRGAGMSVGGVIISGGGGSTPVPLQPRAPKAHAHTPTKGSDVDTHSASSCLVCVHDRSPSVRINNDQCDG